jgi:hypothetical protein
VNLDEVDTGDGDKIVDHVFGSNRDQVVNQLGAAAGPADSSLLGKLLPMLAPIAMAYVAKQVKERGATTAGNGGGGGLVDILGSVLGGAGGGGAKAAGSISAACSAACWAAAGARGSRGSARAPTG